MSQLNLSHTLTAGTPENVNDLMDNFNDIVDHFNNALIGTDNLTESSVLIPLGLGSTRRGKSIIATEESRTNTAYGTLTTPDQVTVTMPSDGLIAIAYQAMFKNSVSSAGSAAIFVGANQVKGALNNNAAPVVQEADGLSVADSYRALSSTQIGLSVGLGSAAYTGHVTTGQIISRNVDDSGASTGGPTYIFATAGSYTVSVQFKSTSGSISAKERKLWVWTMGF